MTSSISTSSSTVHEILPLEVLEHLTSFLDYPMVLRLCSTDERFFSFKEVLERSHFSTVPIFNRANWKEYWNAEITDEYEPSKIDIRVLRAFLKCYWGPNPIGEGKVKDHCLLPTVVPAKVQFEDVMLNYCLNVAELLAKQPKKGHAAKYSFQTEALKQHGDTESEKDELVILLKGVVARKKPWSEQVQYLKELNDKTGYGCEPTPAAIEQVTVSFAHHAVTAERPFGNYTGMEKRNTNSRTREEVVREGDEETSHMVSGLFHGGAKDPGNPWKDSTQAALNVSDTPYDTDYEGVGVVRKF